MAKVQGKTAAAGGKKGAAKAAKNVASRLKSAVAVVKKKVVAKAKPAPKAAKPAKAAARPIPKPVAKAAKKPSKPVAAPKSVPKAAKPAPKPAPRPAPKPAPPKPAAKVAVAPKAVAPKAVPPKAVPPKAVTAKPAVAAPPKSAPVAKAPAAVDDKKRVRRPRTRVTSNGAATANWFAQGEKPRPSSFIPAPPRAEAPSLIAAPPASSDRLIRPEDVTDLAVRTVPVRVDIEQAGGRVYIGINPEEASLRVGEGIEWDFRYIGGTDVTVDEIIIEFEKPSPFSQAVFKSRKPGTARPHRQLSGAAQKAAAGKRVRYTIKAMTPFKTQMAIAAPYVSVAD